MQPPTSLSAAGDTVFCVKGNLRDEGSNCGLKLLLSYQGMEEEQSVAFPNKSTATPRLLLFPTGIMGRREGGIGGGEDDSADIKNKLYKRPLPLRRRSGYIGAKNTGLKASFSTQSLGYQMYPRRQENGKFCSPAELRAH